MRIVKQAADFEEKPTDVPGRRSTRGGEETSENATLQLGLGSQ